MVVSGPTEGAIWSTTAARAGTGHVGGILKGKVEGFIVDRVAVFLVAGVAGAVHYKFDVFRAVSLLEFGAEQHAEGAEAVDDCGFDLVHLGPFWVG